VPQLQYLERRRPILIARRPTQPPPARPAAGPRAPDRAGSPRAYRPPGRPVLRKRLSERIRRCWASRARDRTTLLTRELTEPPADAQHGTDLRQRICRRISQGAQKQTQCLRFCLSGQLASCQTTQTELYLVVRHSETDTSGRTARSSHAGQGHPNTTKKHQGHCERRAKTRMRVKLLQATGRFAGQHSPQSIRAQLTGILRRSLGADSLSIPRS
jgi:hypothetical protein